MTKVLQDNPKMRVYHCRAIIRIKVTSTECSVVFVYKSCSELFAINKLKFEHKHSLFGWGQWGLLGWNSYEQVEENLSGYPCSAMLRDNTDPQLWNLWSCLMRPKHLRPSPSPASASPRPMFVTSPKPMFVIHAFYNQPTFYSDFIPDALNITIEELCFPFGYRLPQKIKEHNLVPNAEVLAKRHSQLPGLGCRQR